MAEATIGSLSGVIDLMRQENNVRNDELKKSQQGTEKNTSDLNKTMREILDEIKKDRLQNEEDRREAKKSAAKEKTKADPLGSKDMDISWPGLSIAAWIAGLGRGLLGWLEGLRVGWVKAIKDFGKSLGGAIRAFFRMTYAVFHDAFLILGRLVRRLATGLGEMIFNSKPVVALRRAISNLGVAYNFGVNRIASGIRSVTGQFRKLNFLENAFKSVGKVVGNLSRGMDSRFGGIISAIRNFGFNLRYYLTYPADILSDLAKGFPNVTKVVTGVSTFFKELFAGTKLLGSISTTMTETGGLLKGTLGRIWTLVSGVGKAIWGFLSPLRALFSSVGGMFKSLVSPIFRVFGAVGKFIAWPITIIMGIYDGITGFMRGWQEREGQGMFNQITGAISGALGGIASGLIGIPLDLLKSLVSWIAGKLGFENFAEWLDSFSFADMIKGMFDAFGQIWIDIKDWLFGLFTSEDPIKYITDGIASAWNALTGIFEDMWDGIKSFVRRAWRGRPRWLGGDGSFSLFTGSNSTPEYRNMDGTPNPIGNDTPPVTSRRQVSGTEGSYSMPDNAGTNRGTPENAQRAVNFFVDKGLTAEQAAGIVGNLQAESGQNLNPNARRDNDAGPGLHSYGIAQWNRDRWNGLNAFARERGKPWNDFDTQLEYVWHELNGRESAALQRLRATTSAADAAAVIDEYYERSSGEHRQRRIANAARLSPSGEGMLSPPSSTNRTNAGEMLAGAGSMSPSLGSLFAQVNVGGSSTSNTAINNNTTQAIMGSAFDASAMFGGPWMQAAQALPTS